MPRKRRLSLTTASRLHLSTSALSLTNHCTTSLANQESNPFNIHRLYIVLTLMRHVLILDWKLKTHWLVEVIVAL